ncbi:AAA family ATPase [Microbacterium sp.]|uniref:AAA family ATPase n=1 Tax=Microbacterium sp. TaxID=51671 RepID=UPI0025EB4B34|nr:AAA family ATPase [Microbacterium sp.]MBT9605937.1 AAA family ATPase [Microbacterium sp.]
MTSDLTTMDVDPEEAPAGPHVNQVIDPRALLADWANKSDEWVRLLVSEVLVSGRPVGDSTVEKAYQLFRQEKALDERVLPVVPPLSVEARQDESAPPLTLTRLSKVRGVNALVSGSVIEPHEGLTVLYGENGTGKTGYTRILKALANSRTADTILGNIDDDVSDGQSATLDFKLGEEQQSLAWAGDRGVSPFTRMSIFDSPAVTTHVDEDLDYVYVPAALALFKHVTTAVQAVAGQVDAAISALGSGNSGLINRFQRGSGVYPLIEALGASTDLATLKSRVKSGREVEAELDSLVEAVAALRSNTMGAQITALKSEQRVLAQTVASADALLLLDVPTYNQAITLRAQLNKDHETFRNELFAAANLPAEPEETWNGFVESGEAYRQHLVEVEAHDEDRCLYCRQPLLDPARDLLRRYSTYLDDKISADIRATEAVLTAFSRQVANISNSELIPFIEQYAEEEGRPGFHGDVVLVEAARSKVAAANTAAVAVAEDVGLVEVPRAAADGALTATRAKIEALEAQQQNRTKALEDKQAELLELKDAVELGRSWLLIEAQVKSAKEADRLRTLKRPLPGVGRAVTELSKTASNQLVNQSFDALFIEECEALRTPPMKLQFVGRDGKAHRRKVMTGKHKPSKVLSEGEQKVLALADFLAEARLAGITAPVIFDDPVSSLDHRRINEVAQRIVRLSEKNQVMVFTHDILFATTLLNLVEKSKRCAYFQITDENGKGKVTPGTAPRIDSVSAIKGRINKTIQAANAQEGEVRDALVRATYNHIRAWCEVFTEEELLKGVTRRYQPNVQMSTLANIDLETLGEIIPKVTEIFDIACRYIDGHSQALVTLSVSPTLTGVEQHWAELQDLKRLSDGKS